MAHQRLAPILRDWFKNSSGCHDLARKMISRPARKRWQPKGSPPARPGPRRTRNAPDCARQAPSRCARSGRAPIGPGEMATREVVRLRERPWPRRRRAPPAPRRPRAADAGMQSETRGVAWRAAPAAHPFPAGASGPQERAEPTDKPGSVVDSHSSRPCVAARLQRPTRARCGPHHDAPIWSCSRWGLPCRSVAGLAVRSYRTVSPLPRAPGGAVRRSALCCTFRRLAPPRRYLAPCPVEPGLSSAHPKMRRDCLVDSAGVILRLRRRITQRFSAKTLPPAFRCLRIPAAAAAPPSLNAAVCSMRHRGHVVAT